MTFSRSIHTQYLEFEPAVDHREGCSRFGTAVWEVARDVEAWLWKDPSEYKTTFRFLCRECGVVRFEEYKGEPALKTTISTSEVGYGCKPERVKTDLGEVWLHPGPRQLYRDERGPAAYYVTATKQTPTDHTDVIGTVAWHRGKRGGQKWGAGYRPTPDGTVERGTGLDLEFASKRAAVRWVLEQHQVETEAARVKGEAAAEARRAQLTEAELEPARKVIASMLHTRTTGGNPYDRPVACITQIRDELGISLSEARDRFEAIRERDQTDSGEATA